MHAIPLAWALLLQLGYNAQQFAGPLLLKKITTFLTNSRYAQQQVRYASKETKTSCCLFDHLALLADCLRYLQDLNVSINYLWAALMFVCPMIGAVLYVHSSRLSIIVQIKMRAELTAAVYRKALALSSR